MFRFFRFFSLLLLACAGSLFAYSHPCPGGWSLDAEYLFLWPSIDASYFVIQSDTRPVGNQVIGERKTNDFDFQSGFRVGGVYTLCDCCELELHAYYTRLRAQHERTVSNGFLFATTGSAAFDPTFQGFTGSAHSNEHLLYQRVDAFLEKHLCQCDCYCPLDFYFEAGVVWSYIHPKTDLLYQANPIEDGLSQGPTRDASTTFQSKIYGIGPQIGLEFDYGFCELSPCFCSGKLSLVGFTSGSLLISRADGSSQSFNFSLTSDVRDEHSWRIIPNFYARIGLNYEACFSCFDASIEVGYELNSYIRAIPLAISTATNASRIFTNFYNFNVQGLYVAVNFGF